MKKFLFVLMGLVVCSGAMAKNINTCGVEMSVSFDGIQGPKNNEFIFVDKESFETAKNHKRNDSVNLTGGVWECDNKHCKNDSEIVAPAGHVFRGAVQQSSKRYRCILGAEDRWVVIDDGCVFNGRSIDVGDSLPGVPYAECWTVDSSIANYPHNVQFTVKCVGPGNLKCIPEAECDDTDLPRKCNVANAKDAVQVCKNGKWGSCEVKECQVGYDLDKNTCVKHSQEQVSCKDKRTTPEGKACCDVESTVAVWRDNRCVCINGGEFVFGNGILQPYCKVEGVVQPNPIVIPGPSPYQCDAVKLARLRTWLNEYGNNVQIVMAITEVIRQCDAHNISESDFNNAYTEISIMISKLIAEQNAQSAHINDLAGQIDSKINNLGGELKKWRNIDGSFNTARLASDSIAGVVLGTVGGVVTSSIIKKNQVEDGFEDIKCAIGGQSVASYGDQFSVGLQ
ncbi:MAG: hypothetical protein ACLRFJ_02015 [Alphaproteobacteria bacterium]